MSQCGCPTDQVPIERGNSLLMNVVFHCCCLLKKPEMYCYSIIVDEDIVTWLVGWGEVESKKRRYWDGVCSQTQHHPDLLPIHICILIVSSGWIICCSFNYQYFQNQQWLVCQLCAFNRNITVHWAKVILYIGSVFEICVAWEISWSIWKCLTNISVVSRWLAQDSPLRVARRTDMQTCPPGASPLLCKIQIQIQMQIQILTQIQRQM